MANPEHLAKLKEGIKAWNRWRKPNPTIQPDLFEANLDSADLTGANLKKADLVGAKLSGAKLSKADLRAADLSEAYLSEADLSGAKLAKAYLREADLSRVNLSEANLSRANLSKAFLYKANLSMADLAGVDLSRVNLIEANLSETKLIGANFHGVITSKIVLILGRFIPERKVVLDAIREKLRKRGYVSVLCGFGWTTEKKVTEITMLANMARFIIADLTDPMSALYELSGIVPDITVPVKAVLPEIEGLQREYSSFFHPERSHWFLKPYHYKSPEILIVQLDDQVIAPAEASVTVYEPERAHRPPLTVGKIMPAEPPTSPPFEEVQFETPPKEVQLDVSETPFEEVQLGASAPRDMCPGEDFVARFAAYIESHRRKVYRVLAQEAPSAHLRHFR